MGYQSPSRKKTKKGFTKPPITSLLDAIFIFLFFLLFSADFNKAYEIPTDVPVVSDAEPPPEEKKPKKDPKPPLALTIKIKKNKIQVYTGVPSKLAKSFGKDSAGKYELYPLHQYLVTLKKEYKKEKTVIFEPEITLRYKEIVGILDAVRYLEKTDDTITRINDKGEEEDVTELFNNIVFGNIKS